MHIADATMVGMHTTPVTLLERLRTAGDEHAWHRFVGLYTPLLCSWARRLGCSETDLPDLVQEVLTQLVEKLPAFQYDPDRSFRGWLRAVAHNRWRNLQRRAQLPMSGGVPADDLADPNPPDPFWESDYRRHLFARALTLMQTEFEPTTWQACLETVVHGKPAAVVALELGLSPAAVYVAKSRVLSRLRHDLAGLWE
jgi:RNA polymerase sigma-70 factor (ECF subfamily)